MTGQHRLAPSPELLRHWRIIRWLLIVVVAGLGAGSWWLAAAASTPSAPQPRSGGMAAHWPPFGSTSATPTSPAPPSRAQRRPVGTPSAIGPIALTASGPSMLASGSDPSVLPGPLLIADDGGNRLLIIDSSGRMMWQFPRPGDMPAGQTFKAPDDAFFTPNGRQVVATGEDDHIIRVIDIATHKVVYSYGTAGVPGSGPNQVNGPDGALMLPSGGLLVPDINNCRVIMVGFGAHTTSRQLGQTGTCAHRPPLSFAGANGMFPMANGDYLLTEGTGGWVSELNLSGRVSWSVQLPGVSYIYESTVIGPDRYLTVDHALPGQVLIFDHTGRVLWRYAPTERQALNMPSLAIPLPGGDVMVSDKGNHRIIVVDPRTSLVVWQYGQSKVAGSSPGFLNKPAGMDLYPPNSLAVKNAATMGEIPR